MYNDSAYYTLVELASIYVYTFNIQHIINLIHVLHVHVRKLLISCASGKILEMNKF